MTQLFALTSRNLKRFFRDKGAIFFSLLSMLIIIVLMFFFAGDSYSSGITGILERFPNRDVQADEDNAALLMLAWTCAGIVSINAVTVTLASLFYMIEDRERGKLASIYTAPVSRLVIAGGYVLAAWLTSVVMCTATLLLSELYCVGQGMQAFSLQSHIRLIGMIGANSFTYAAMMYLVATGVKSSGAWSGLGTVVGTLVGFLGGIYMPVGEVSDSIAGIMKCTPVLYGTAMFRKEMTAQITKTTFEGIPSQVVEEMERVMGTQLQIGDRTLTAAHELGILLLCGIIFLLTAVLAIRFSKKKRPVSAENDCLSA